MISLRSAHSSSLQALPDFEVIASNADWESNLAAT
jgi:hypothetical protein